jgi:hypothetical protein
LETTKCSQKLKKPESSSLVKRSEYYLIMAKRLPHFEVGGTYEHNFTGEIATVLAKAEVDTAGRRPFGWRGSVRVFVTMAGKYNNPSTGTTLTVDNSNIHLWKRLV